MKKIDFTTGRKISSPDVNMTSAEQTPSAEEFIFDETDFDLPAFLSQHTYGNEQPFPPIQKYRGQVYEKKAFAEMMQKYFNRNKG